MSEWIIDRILLVQFQVLILSVFLWLVSLVFKGSRPPVIKSVLNLGMVGMILVLLMAFVPFPSWFSGSFDRSPAPVETASYQFDDFHNASVRSTDQIAQPEKKLQAALSTMEKPTSISEGFGLDAQESQSFVLPAVQDWKYLLGISFLVISTLGITRFFVQILRLREIHRQSAPLVDQVIWKETIRLSEVIGLRKVPCVRISESVGIAATFGFFRQRIYLSPSTLQLEKGQIQAILSHELSHVYAKDFLFRIVAGFCQACYFLNPFLHWMTRHLNWVQEISCDLNASKWAGGIQEYRKNLAKIAMTEDSNSGRVSLALNFHCSGNKIIARLKKMKTIYQDSMQQNGKALKRSLLVLTLTCLIGVAGLRPPVNAQQDSNGKEVSSISLDYISEKADFAAVLRPQRLRKIPKLFPLLEIQPTASELFVSDGLFKNLTGGNIKDFKQIALYFQLDKKTGSPASPITIIQSKVKIIDSLPAVAKKDGKVARKDVWIPKDGKKFGSNDWGVCKYGVIVDEKTMIWAVSKEQLEQAVSVKRKSAAKTKWYSMASNQLKNDGLLIVGNQMFANMRERRKRSPNERLAFEVPDLISADYLIARVQVKKDAEVEIGVKFPLKSNATKVQKGLMNQIKILKPMAMAKANDESDRFSDLGLIGLDILDSTSVRKKGSEVHVSLKVPLRPKTFLMFAKDSREASNRVASMNNMKIIGYSMHLYHQEHGHFPPPVIKSKNGKLHSWRIAVLKNTDDQILYNQYRFDEDWDSPHNKKLTEKVSATHDHPVSTSKTATSYYLVTGPGTIYPDGKSNDGISMDKITDGLSNTIVAVEANLDRHWTDPTPVTFDDIYKNGKFQVFQEDNKFNVLMADGSVRTLDADVNIDYFKALLSPSGGEDLKKIPRKKK